MAIAPSIPQERRVRLNDGVWVATQVRRFKRLQPRYAAYAQFLKDLLSGVCRHVAPLAVVQARPKSIASFAEKILRKREAYGAAKQTRSSDPLVRTTDLCGARVILHTGEQIQALCRFIEAAFVIDQDNSEDRGQRLKPVEFGYRSVHYIARVSPEKLKAAGAKLHLPRQILRVKPETLRQIRGLSAEIQVRTLLAHAWADIAHDLTYKPEMKVPARIQRPFNALAAVLEGADREFGLLLAELSEFNSNFGAYHPREEVEAEMGRLRIVLAQERDVEHAVKLADLALSIGDHESARDVLESYKSQDHPRVRRALGLALCELHRDQPQSKAYVEGRRYLEAACDDSRKNAETLCALAEACACSDENKTRKLFQEALKTDPAEPLTLCRYLEFEIGRKRSVDIVRWSTPLIRNAMERCRKQIEVGVNLPTAWTCLSVFHLLMGEPYPALDALAQVIRLCEPASGVAGKGSSTQRGPHRSGRLCPSSRLLQRTRETLDTLHAIKAGLPGFEWFRRTLLLGLAIRVKDLEARKQLNQLASWGHGKAHLSRKNSFMILSGACTKELQRRVDRFKPHLRRACGQLAFTLLSGGTRNGISNLAGDIAQQSRGRVRAFGYLPLQVPGDRNLARYTKLIQSAGKKFTPMDPLQGWTDLVAVGVDPRRVKLLCYGGGQIAGAECAVALALGARVGIVEDPDLPARRKFKDSDWQEHPNLLRLPMDAMTLRAFFLMEELPRSPKKLLKAAQRMHEDYRKSAVPAEPSLQQWEKLPKDLQLSNFHQVVYARNILESVGWGIRKRGARGRSPLNMEKTIGKEGLRYLAKMEHGRWNVERLSQGWKHAGDKDIAKKQSPYIVSWQRLPNKIKEYDYATVRNWPKIFHVAGLEIYRLSDADREAAKSNKP